MNNYSKKEIYCANCGQDTHIYRNCPDPITSCGIVLIKLDIDNKYKKEIIAKLKQGPSTNIFDVDGIYFENMVDLELFCKYKNNIKFLMIRRKHTLGFIEFIRGHYKVDDIEGIIKLFKQMVKQEIELISTCNFDELWSYCWGEYKLKSIYQTEYHRSKILFEKLKDDSCELNLKFYTSNVKPMWQTAEWGFPKGRRSNKESDLECALREFKEETNYKDDEFILANKIEPINENLIGTNNKKYKHIYYVAFSTTNKAPDIDEDNVSQQTEIGDIRYYNFDDAIKLIRTYHSDKQKIIIHLYSYIMNILIDVIKNPQKVNI